VWTWPRAALAWACLATAGLPAVADDTDFAAQVHGSATMGREHQSAPIFRIDPQGAVLLLPGRHQVDSEHLQWDAQAFLDGALPGDTGWRWALASSLKLRQARPDKAMDLGMASAEPALSRSFPAGTLGLALTWQRMSSGGQALRTQRGLRLDWTVVTEGQLQSWSLDATRPRYAAGFEDLDSRQASMNWMLRQDLTWPGISQLMLALNAQRERNRHGLPELSSRAGSVQLQLQGPLGDRRDTRLQWTASLMRQIQHFDASAFADADRRRDRWLSLDLGLSQALGKGSSLQLELNLARNRSTLAPYALDYHQLSLRLAQGW